ncbi:hypothetical protein [Lusitaniella coriacea]|uniref:hypothetical protein n=1 Tax=Lusitaniella coriacea TaxID=1983105 RepID=UPI003CEA27F9
MMNEANTDFPARDASSRESTNGKRWWHKFVAVIAVANLLLVFFNLSYIPLRDVYLRYIPAIVHRYDPIKSIEPHPDTQRYLDTVDRATQQFATSGLEAAPTATLLKELRQQSTDLIAENPFSVANKFATFAKLKRRMEYQLDIPSAQQAFATFWSSPYLAQVGWDNALTFFDEKIRPLLAVAYFRAIDENGQFVDYFWQIDLYFIAFFALEFLGRTFLSSRRYEGLSWGDAILRRWYDGLMLLPTWRWLRLLPVLVRLHKSGLVNMQRILAQITHEPAAYLADRTSTFLLLRLVNQTQEAVDTGEAAQAILQPQNYLRVSDIDKVDAIIDRVLKLSIYKVLPQVQPDVEALLRHSLKGAFKESDFFHMLQQIPGMQVLPMEVTEQFSEYLAQATYEVLANSYADLQGRELFDHLTQNFKQTLKQELQDKATQAELQSLLSDLLEELKLNYIQGSVQKNPEATLAEAEQLRQDVEERS